MDEDQTTPAVPTDHDDAVEAPVTDDAATSDDAATTAPAEGEHKEEGGEEHTDETPAV